MSVLRLARGVAALRIAPGGTRPAGGAVTAEALEALELEPGPELAPRRNAALEQSRQKSRLSRAHTNLVRGLRPYEQPACLAHRTVKWARKMYGSYGEASGVNPSLCWPSRTDLAEVREYESVAFPFTIQQMAEQVREKRDGERRRIQEREHEVATKLAKLSQWKKELTDRIERKTKEAVAAKEKKERLVEEVRRHFGFTIDPRDERFQELLAKREKEQKKQDKLAKKEAKEKQMITKLQKKNAAISSASNDN